MYKNKEQRNKERYEIKKEVLRMLERRGMSLIRTGHLFIVRSKIGSVFQSHDIFEVKRWLLEHQTGLLTDDLHTPYVDDRKQPVKYGRTFTP